MPYRTLGRIHANVARLWRETAGQGTVEYVGLMLLLATVLTSVVAVAGGLVYWRASRRRAEIPSPLAAFPRASDA